MTEHLSQIYNTNPRTRGKVQSLEELTGLSSTELDLQYGAYLQNTRDTLDQQRRTPIGQESPAAISRQ